MNSRILFFTQWFRISCLVLPLLLACLSCNRDPPALHVPVSSGRQEEPGAAGADTPETEEAWPAAGGLAAAVHSAPKLDLPLRYSYELVSNEPALAPVDSGLTALLQLPELQDLRIAALPAQGRILPVVVVGTAPSGQTCWYLMTTGAEGRVIDRLRIYDSEEEDEGGALSTTFDIAAGLRATVTTMRIRGDGPELVRDIVRERSYRLATTGRFIVLQQ